MGDLSSPFVPGARVAIRSGYNDNYTEAFVEKVYKTGNFTLKGQGAQQWRPSYYQNFHTKKTHWEACRTGRDPWSRTSLVIWDETTDAEISEKIAATKHRERLRDLQERLHRMKPEAITEEALDRLEAALTEKDRQP